MKGLIQHYGDEKKDNNHLNLSNSFYLGYQETYFRDKSLEETEFYSLLLQSYFIGLKWPTIIMCLRLWKSKGLIMQFNFPVFHFVLNLWVKKDS